MEQRIQNWLVGAQKTLALFLLLIPCGHCAVNLKQVPDPPVVRAPYTRCNLPLYLGRMQVRSRDSDHLFEQNLKRSFAGYLAARRVFPVISELPEKVTGMSAHHLILDADLRVDFSDSYNWWVTWPAVYPAIAYWPIQIRKGEVHLVLSVSIVDESGTVKTRFEKQAEGNDTVAIYGFFRAGALENLIRLTVADVFRASAETIADNEVSLCGEAKQPGDMPLQREK